MLKIKLHYLIYFAFLLSLSANAKTYYSRTTGNWNAASSWSTITYGNNTNSGTFPQNGDTVKIGDGHSITITANAVCSELSIGQGTSGILYYSNSGNRTFTINGDLNVEAGASFLYNKNSGRSHVLNVYGSVVNNGSIDFFYDNNDLVNANFYGNSASISGNGSWDLNNSTMNLTNSSDTLNILSTTFENSIRGTLSLTKGVYIHNNASTFNCNPSLNNTIGANASVVIPMGAMNFSTNANYLYLQGSLFINGGDCTIGLSSGAVGIATDQNGTGVPYLEISSGTLDINGGLTSKSTSTTEPFHFKMTGGNLLLQTCNDPSAYESFKVTDVAGSIFEMYGGKIEIEQANVSSSNSLPDFDLCGTNGQVYSTNGIVQFGNSNTKGSTEFNFKPYSNVIYPNFHLVDGDVMPSAGSGNTAHFKLLSLQIDNGCKFDIRSIKGTKGDKKIMFLCGNSSGYAFVNDGNFKERNGSVIFGDDTLQHIGGSTATQFEDFEINNTAGLMIDTSISINGLLTLTDGLINTNTSNLITLHKNSTVPIGSAFSYVNGPMIIEVASNATTTLNFPIGTDNAYRPVVMNVKHSTNNQVEYWGRVVDQPASALPYTLPSSFSSVSDIRYWQFVRTGSNNFSNGLAQLFYGADDGVSDPNNLRIGQVLGSDWIDEGGLGTAAVTGSITSNTFNSFSGIFTLANSTGGSNSLPIELLSFDAKWVKDGSQLKWTTASEINNNYFEVLRSFDGINFETINRQVGAGNSTQNRDYSYFDKINTSKLIYYRLKQTDFDGAFTYSEIKTVRGQETSDLSQISLYPTLSNGNNICLSMKNAKFTKLLVSIFDDQGRLYNKQIVLPNQQTLRLTKTNGLENGNYFAVIEGQIGRKVIPFIITN